MTALDTMLENPKAALETSLDYCLRSCYACQVGIGKTGLTNDWIVEHPVGWAMLCEHHAPMFRAKADPAYLMWIRVEIKTLNTKLAKMKSAEEILQLMENGADMLGRGKIDQQRFDTRIAELEGMRRARIEAENNVVYWQKILEYATASEIESYEVDDD